MSLSLEVRGTSEIVVDFTSMRGVLPKAIVRTMNRAIASARTVGVRAIAQDTGLKSSDVRDRIALQNATVANPQARLAASLDRLPLYIFGAKGPVPSRGKGRGVTAKNPGGKGRYPHAFIATMASGHTGVFERVGKARLPIRELSGPSLGHVFAKYRPQMLDAAATAFETNFDHELDFASGLIAPAGA